MRITQLLNKHHCRTIFNPSAYQIQHSYNSLPFKPKSLLFATSPTETILRDQELKDFSFKNPDIQIIAASLDMKQFGAIGEIWFDKLIKINSFKPFMESKKINNENEIIKKFDPNNYILELHSHENEFSFWINDKKITTNLENSIVFGKIGYSCYFKQPGVNNKFSNYLTHLEIELPFDINEIEYSSKSQAKATSPKMLITELRDSKSIKTLNYKINALKYFKELSKSNVLKFKGSKSFIFALEISSKLRSRNRYLPSIDFSNEPTLTSMDLNLNHDEIKNEKTYLQFYKICLQDLKEPEISNGLIIETYNDLAFNNPIIEKDVIIDGIFHISNSKGFSSNGRRYILPGDYVKVESIT